MAIGAKVKGITIEFDGDTTKLGSALKKIDNEAKGIDKSLRQVNNALKFNPKNTELVAQKQVLLKQKIDSTRERLEALKRTQKQLDDDPSVDKTSQDYMELRREIITTESKLKHFEAEQKKLNRYKFDQLGKSFQTVGSKITSVGRTMTTTMSIFAAAAVYAGSKLIKMSQAQAQAEQKLTEIYKTRMGVDKKAVQSTLALAAAEQKLGVVGDEVQIAGAQQLATYAKTPATVNKMIPALNNLLVQQKGLNGTQEDAKNIANMFGKAMMGQTGALKRAGISFSDAEAEVLKYGTEEEKAAMIAKVVTKNVGHMNKAFAKTDAGKIQQAKNTLGDMGEQIGAILLPAVADLVSWLQAKLMPKLQAFIGWMQQHPKVAKFALAIAGVSAAIGPLVMIIGTLTSGIGTLIRLLPLLLSPIGLIIAAIAALVVGIVLLWKKSKAFRDFFKKLWTGIKTVVKAVIDFIIGYFKFWYRTITAVWSGASKFFRGVVNKLKSAFQSVGSFFEKVKNAIMKPILAIKNGIQGIIDKLKAFFKFNGKKVKLPNVKGKSPALKWYASGGVFNRPSVIGVGEAGSEAVVPLNKLWQKMDQLYGNGGGGLVVNVYGSSNMSVDELANAVQRKIIAAQKRRTLAWQ